jgi:hypothetical protein
MIEFTKLIQSEWFWLKSPIGEPDLKWESNISYTIERKIDSENTIIWYGKQKDWRKKINQNWEICTTNWNAKPIEKHLPKIVYDSDRYSWQNCEIPIYETLYQNQLKNG